MKTDNAPAEGKDLAVLKTGAAAIENWTTKDMMNQLWSVATTYAQGGAVPSHFQKNVPACAIIVDLALTMRRPILTLFQNVGIVHGMPRISAKFARTLAEQSGAIKGRIKLEVEGEDPFDKNFRVRAWAVMADDGEKVVGDWIDWRMVRAEKWDDKRDREGKSYPTKWNTMPGLMFRYRAIDFLINAYFPGVKFGLQTAEEAADVPAEAIDVTPPGDPLAQVDDLPVREVEGTVEVAAAKPGKTSQKRRGSGAAAAAKPEEPAPEVPFDRPAHVSATPPGFDGVME